LIARTDSVVGDADQTLCGLPGGGHFPAHIPGSSLGQRRKLEWPATFYDDSHPGSVSEPQAGSYNS